MRNHVYTDVLRRALLPSILLLALGLRIIAMQGKSLWYDELQSVTHASLPIPDLLAAVQTYDPHPPLYYLQLHFWLLLGTSDGWIKLNSVLWSLLTILSFYWIVRKHVNQRSALLAALFLAISPYTVNYGIEVRNYSLWMLLAVWAYEFNHQLLLTKRKFPAGVGLFLVTTAFLYLHGISFLILPALYAHTLILLLQRKISLSQLWNWVIVQIVIVLAYIPWLLRAWTIRNVGHAVIPGLDDIVSTIYFQLLGYCSQCSVGFQASFVIAWISICIYVAYHWSYTRLIILAYVFTPILATILISYFLHPIWLFRGLGLIVPFMFLTLAIWLDSLLDLANWQKWIALSELFLIISLFAVTLLNQFRTLVYPWDFKRAAEHVASQIQTGEVILLSHERVFWCWNWYFVGPGTINPIERVNSINISNGIRITTLPASLSPPKNGGYWQVYRDIDFPPVSSSSLIKRIWDFEGLNVEYIPIQP